MSKGEKLYHLIWSFIWTLVAWLAVALLLLVIALMSQLPIISIPIFTFVAMALCIYTIRTDSWPWR